MKKNTKEESNLINIEETQKYISNLYGVKPLYPGSDGYDQKETARQVGILCSTMEKIGLKNFGLLRDKFSIPPPKNQENNVRMIKDSMEAIVYKVKNGIENGAFSKETIASQFSDREFLCVEGTLLNLESILGEMSIGYKTIYDLFDYQKENMIEQIILENLMSQTRDSQGYGTTFTELYLSPGSEIHNVLSLKNAVADIYNLSKTTKEKDRYIVDIGAQSRGILIKTLSDKFYTKEFGENLIDGIVNTLSRSLPYYKEGMDKNKHATSIMDALERFGITSQSGLISNATFFKYNNYQPEIKENLFEIIKDVVMLKLNEKGSIRHPRIDTIKVRLIMESSMDDMSAQNMITKDAINYAKDLKLMKYAFEYIIPKDTKLNAQEFDNISEPLEYCLKNKIDIDFQKEKDNKLDSLIKKYLGESDNQKKEDTAKEYKCIQNIGLDKNVELIGMDSDFGKFLSRKDAPKLLKDFQNVYNHKLNDLIDYRKCDLKFIEECIKAIDKSESKKFTDLSFKQKFSRGIKQVANAVLCIPNMDMEKQLDRGSSVFNKIKPDLEKINFKGINLEDNRKINNSFINIVNNRLKKEDLKGR